MNGKNEFDNEFKKLTKQDKLPISSIEDLILKNIENYKNELVCNLSFSSQYCLELLLAYCQGINIVILHQMYEYAWSHTIESIIEEFSLIGAAVVFSRLGHETLMKLPIHSYDLNNVTIE